VATETFKLKAGLPWVVGGGGLAQTRGSLAAVAQPRRLLLLLLSLSVEVYIVLLLFFL
jgi:hypothetical protein